MTIDCQAIVLGGSETSNLNREKLLMAKSPASSKAPPIAPLVEAIWSLPNITQDIPHQKPASTESRKPAANLPWCHTRLAMHFMSLLKTQNIETQPQGRLEILFLPKA